MLDYLPFSAACAMYSVLVLVMASQLLYQFLRLLVYCPIRRMGRMTMVYSVTVLKVALVQGFI